MIKIFMLIVGCLASANINAQVMDDHLWSERVIIIKTKEAQCEKYQSQIAVFEHAEAALRERKIVIYFVNGSSYHLIDYKHPEPVKDDQVSKKFAEEFFRDENKFEIILIGLDGGLKLRQTEVISKESLFDTIDSMPRRQSELNRND